MAAQAALDRRARHCHRARGSSSRRRQRQPALHRPARWVQALPDFDDDPGRRTKRSSKPSRWPGSRNGTDLPHFGRKLDPYTVFHWEDWMRGDCIRSLVLPLLLAVGLGACASNAVQPGIVNTFRRASGPRPWQRRRPMAAIPAAGPTIAAAPMAGRRGPAASGSRVVPCRRAPVPVAGLSVPALPPQTIRRQRSPQGSHAARRRWRPGRVHPRGALAGPGTVAAATAPSSAA